MIPSGSVHFLLARRLVLFYMLVVYLIIIICHEDLTAGEHLPRFFNLH
jgi:hypothetical protein